MSWFRRGAPGLDCVPDQAQAPGLRRTVLRAAGVALGVAGASALADELAPTARAAGTRTSAAAQTTVETTPLAPAVVALTDGPTISVDASAGNDFRVTLGGNRTIGTPSNPVDGQQIIFQITQGPGGSATVTWDTGYAFPSGLPQPILSTSAGQTDVLGFIYSSAKEEWLHAAFVNGFA